MEKTTENNNGVLAIISLLQEKFPKSNLGNYVEHYICEDNTYKVVFTNNTTIKIHRTTVQDAEIDIRSVTDESLDRIIETLKCI